MWVAVFIRAELNFRVNIFVQLEVEKGTKFSRFL